MNRPWLGLLVLVACGHPTSLGAQLSIIEPMVAERAARCPDEPLVIRRSGSPEGVFATAPQASEFVWFLKVCGQETQVVLNCSPRGSRTVCVVHGEATSTAVDSGAVVAPPPTLPVAAKVQAEQGPLVVEGIPTQANANVGERFDIVLRVVNTSAKTERIRIMACSWPAQWKTNDSFVGFVTGEDCRKNPEVAVDILPGSTDTRTLKLVAAKGTPPGPRTLQVGFTPIGAAAIWSTDISIMIVDTGTPSEQP